MRGLGQSDRHGLLTSGSSTNCCLWRRRAPAPLPSNRPASVIRRREEHSKKTGVVLRTDWNRMYGELPRVELFCRSPREGAAWATSRRRPRDCSQLRGRWPSTRRPTTRYGWRSTARRSRILQPRRMPCDRTGMAQRGGMIACWCLALARRCTWTRRCGASITATCCSNNRTRAPRACGWLRTWRAITSLTRCCRRRSACCRFSRCATCGARTGRGAGGIRASGRITARTTVNRRGAEDVLFGASREVYGYQWEAA